MFCTSRSRKDGGAAYGSFIFFPCSFCRPFLTPSFAVYSLLLDVAKHNKKKNWQTTKKKRTTNHIVFLFFFVFSFH